VLGVQEHDAELLDRPGPVPRKQIRRDVAQRPQLLTPFRRPHEGPTAQFHGGQNLRRLGHPDPLEATQIDLWLACQPLDAAHRIEHVVRYVDRTRGPKAMDQNDSQ